MSGQRLNIIVVFVLATLAALALSFPWEVPREATQTARTTVSGRSGSLEVRGGINTNRLVCPMRGTCPDLNLWYVFQNRSSQTLSGLHIVGIQAPGFKYDAQDPRTVAAFRLNPRLAPQAASGIEVSLTPLTGSGRYNIELAYAWTNPAGGELREAISLGPVEVSTWWQRSVYNSARRIKDLGLPLMLAFFGWWLQNEQKKRDKEQQEKQTARDERQLVLTTLLPTHVKDTKTLYLPFAARAQGLIERIEGVRSLGNSPPSRERTREELRCVHAFFMLMKRHRFVVQQIGGIQLSSHHGEKVVQMALKLFLTEAIEYRVSQDVNDRALKSVQLWQDFGEFLDSLGSADTDSAISLAAGTWAVLNWIRDPYEPLAKMIPLLTILRDVLLYEMDLPMELWYQERREFPDLADATKQLNQLRVRNPQDRVHRIPGIEEKIKGYLGKLAAQLPVYEKEGKERRV